MYSVTVPDANQAGAQCKQIKYKISIMIHGQIKKAQQTANPCPDCYVMLCAVDSISTEHLEGRAFNDIICPFQHIFNDFLRFVAQAMDEFVACNKNKLWVFVCYIALYFQ